MTLQEISLQDGSTRLSGKVYLPDGKGPFPAVLMAHGYLSSHADYEDLPEKLQALGYVTMVFDFQGHGSSEGVRSLLSAEAHLSNLKTALEALKARPEVDPTRIVLVGHSLGTVPTLKLMAEQGDALRGGIVMAPPAQVLAAVNQVELMLYSTAYKLAKGLHDAFGFHLHVPYKFSAKDVYIDPNAIQRGMQVAPIQSTMSLMNYPYLYEVDNVAVARGIKIPTMVVAAREDKIFTNEDSRKVYDALPIDDKEWVRVGNCGHCLMGDSAKDDVARIVIDWIARHTQATVQKAASGA